MKLTDAGDATGAGVGLGVGLGVALGVALGVGLGVVVPETVTGTFVELPFESAIVIDAVPFPTEVTVNVALPVPSACSVACATRAEAVTVVGETVATAVFEDAAV